jgi:hypothetical protein
MFIYSAMQARQSGLAPDDWLDTPLAAFAVLTPLSVLV